MAIPENITREDIIQALAEIDNIGTPTNREPQGYFLIFNKKAYPPKYVVSIANRFRNGEELPSNLFNSIEAGKIFLRDRGFAIVKIGSIENSINTLQNIINNKNQYPQLASKLEIENKIFSKYHEIFSLNHLPDLSSDEVLVVILLCETFNKFNIISKL